MAPELNDRDTTLKNWFPNTSLKSLRHELAEMVEGVLGNSLAPIIGTTMPRVDISETPDAIEIVSDLPGFRKDDIQVEVGEKTLTISGERKSGSQQNDEGRRYHRVERPTGNFSRTVWLPCPVKENEVEAHLVDGILTITLPKREDARRRKVEIKCAEDEPKDEKK